MIDCSLNWNLVSNSQFLMSFKIWGASGINKKNFPLGVEHTGFSWVISKAFHKSTLSFPQSLTQHNTLNPIWSSLSIILKKIDFVIIWSKPTKMGCFHCDAIPLAIATSIWLWGSTTSSRSTSYYIVLNIFISSNIKTVSFS